MLAFTLLKALHVVSVVAWFAGLFYLPRLFVYHIEAAQKPQPDRDIIQAQLAIMERRLYYGIMWPALCLSFIFGLTLVALTHAQHHPWFQLKFLCVIGLVCYQLFCGEVRLALLSGECGWSSRQMRLINELPALFLIAIVVLVYVKEMMSVTLWAACMAAAFSVMGLLIFRRRK